MKKALFVLSIAILLLAMVIPAFAAPPGKVDICHLTSSDTNEWVLISVNDYAWKDHEAHGDQIVGDTVDENCEPLISTCEVTDLRGITKTYEVPKTGFSTGSTYTSIDSTHNLYYTIAWYQRAACDLLCTIGSQVATTTCNLP